MDECTLNDLLECSVCLDRLDTSSKVLPCQHTFCKKCLDEIICTHRELRCPECRVLVNAKVEDLPPNVLLMRLLEGMKNAIPKGDKTPVKSNNRPQRLVGGHQINSGSPTLTQNNTINTVNSPTDSRQQVNVAAKQVHVQSRPYGRAIYDYISKVPGDLSFRKGDIVTLRKKVDNNWYFGECGASQGVFPLAYIQVMTPLPPHVPQCKALYDFRMMNDEEEGCLTFNKGEIISVIRRVDENWAEGKLLDRIGIFPLAFVELNSVARALMKLSTNVQPGPSRVAPPTPTNEETTPLIPTDHSRTIQTASQSKPPATVAPKLPVPDSSSNVSSGDSSTTTSSPIITSPSSSSSSTSPSSPSSPALSPPVVVSRNSSKRHSFTGINSSHQAQQQHRHSAEILSLEKTGNEEGANDTAPTSNQSAGSNEKNSHHKRSSSNDLVLSQSSQQNLPSNSVNINVPAAYIALYPYKPQKTDELELRKGGIYMVSERCQDGWFKGTSNRTQKCGVFPGNYVVPARFHRTVSKATNSSSPQQNAIPTGLSVSENQRPISSTYSKHKNTSPLQFNIRQLPPPELPPRSASPSNVSSIWHNQRQNQSQNSQKIKEQSNPINLTSRSHNPATPMLFASPGKLLLTTTSTASHIATATVSSSNKNPGNTSTVSSPSASTSAVSPKEKTKEKKEKGVSLMRRLTNIKKSKSPPPTTYSMDNPVFDDGNASQSSNPIHVRSGSCPSQLLQLSPAQDIVNHQRLYPGQVRGTTSQRIRHKERPSLPITFLQRSGESAMGTISNHHRKSNSLDANMGKQVKQQISSRDKVYKFRCIVPYPPNSEFELELQIGDIIYVHKKRDDGWYKGTQQRTGRTGLFPASFVEAF